MTCISFISACSLLSENGKPKGDSSLGPDVKNYMFVLEPTNIKSTFELWDSIGVVFIDSLSIDITGTDNINTGIDDWIVGDYDKSLIDNFQKIMGDSTFFKPSFYRYPYPVFCYALEEISISSNRNYSKGIPGTDVSGLIEVDYGFPGLFVRNGYSVDGIRDEFNSARGNLYILESLNAMNAREDKLGISMDFYFSLIEPPTKTDTFRFTIRYEFEGDRVFETTTPPVILQGLEE